MLSVTRIPANCPLCPKPQCRAPHPERPPLPTRLPTTLYASTGQRGELHFRPCPSPAVAWEVTLDHRHWGIPFQSPDPELTARRWQLSQLPSWKTLKKGKSQVADCPLCRQ